VSLELLTSIKCPYAQLLAARYRLDDAAAVPTTHEEALLAEIGRKRGAVMTGGRINLAKAAEIVLSDFRTATLGRITLETPEEFEVWWAEGEAREAARQAAKLLRGKGKAKGRLDQPWLTDTDTDTNTGTGTDTNAEADPED
jgi:ribosome biogenesis GTPase A